MTDSHVSLVRQLGPRDHLRYAQLDGIRASLAQVEGDGQIHPEAFLERLGDVAEDTALARENEDGSFDYLHFGGRLARDAGFDMTGKSTADFGLETRGHIETSFRAALDGGEPLTTIMPSSPGSDILNWQRFVFPLTLDGRRHVLSVIKPLWTGTDTIHARPYGVAICVVPLRATDDKARFAIAAHEPIENYLPGADLAQLDAFLADFSMPPEAQKVGALMAATTMELETEKGQTYSLVIDIVQGFTAPFLVVANVTGSTRTHAQLRSAEHLLKSSFELGRLGSWVAIGRDKARLLIGPELASMVGVQVDPDGLVDLDTMRSLYDTDLREKVVEAVERCWATGESFEAEGGLTRPDGQWMHVRISGSSMRDEAGRIINLFGLVQDITDQYVARGQIRESEERFRDFAASASDWCWETDQNHCFVDFTPGSSDMSRLLQSRFTGLTRREMPLLEIDRAAVDEHFALLDRQEEFTDFTYRIVGDDGAILTIEISGKPRFDKDGHFLGYRGTARDITEKVAAKRASLENQLALQSAQSIAKLGHWTTDLQSGVSRCSTGLLELLGLPTDEPNSLTPPWRTLLGGVHRNDRKAMSHALRQAALGEMVAPLEIGYQCRNSSTSLHLRIMLRLETGSDTHAAQLIGVAQNVSALKETQIELEKRSATLSEAQEMGAMGDWQYDLASGEVTWSRNLYRILGLEPEHFTPTGKAIFALCGPEDCQAIRKAHSEALAGKAHSSLDVQARRGDGTFGYYTLMTKPLMDRRGAITGLFGTVQDITERKHAEKQLRNLAYFDPLTGLANRALFTRQLNDVMGKVQSKGGSAALLLLDLDHFKEVNDTLGHAAGDELLRRVAHTLKAHIDERGFVARLGGDEFAVIIRNYASVDCLKRFAQSIVSKLTGVLALERGEVLTGTSLGIALIPQDGGTAEEALRNADLALYMAKDEGRGKALFFTPDMSRAVQARLNLARDLRLAIENDHLETRFQGQVDLKSGKVVGFETLVRWKHPTRGYISPAEFIPVAESSSLICDIGLWVLRDACQTGRAWLDAGEPPRMISVNVSAAQIWQSEFEDDVMAIIQETGYPPQLLCLELTESLFADHGEGRVRNALARFDKAGIRLALDDFGTGYSSLGYLSDLPFSELKIDRVFVSGADQAKEKARLLQGIVALGRGLGMTVVAEGAEDEREVELLRSYDCDIVQGFVFTRPEKSEDALRSAEALEFRLAEEGAHLQLSPGQLQAAS